MTTEPGKQLLAYSDIRLHSASNAYFLHVYDVEIGPLFLPDIIGLAARLLSVVPNGETRDVILAAIADRSFDNILDDPNPDEGPNES